MIKLITILLIDFFCEIIGFFFLDAVHASDPTNLLLAAVTGLAGGIVAFFFIYRKEIKEQSARIEKVYETTIKEANIHIANSNKLTEQAISESKELKTAMQRLPDELRNILREK